MEYRVLIWHPESECLFEVNDPLLADSCFSDGMAYDVTDIPEWEARLELQKKGIDFTLSN